MAHLWRQHAKKWTPVALDDVPFVHGSTVGPFGRTWILLAARDATVAVNGAPVRTGMAALADRDEIRWADGERLFFAATAAPIAERLDAPAPDLRCPRCRSPFEPGAAVVRCPAAECGAIHHQSDELPCFAYAESCAVCPQSTALDAALRWSPEGL